jgi:hypothetical protein
VSGMIPRAASSSSDRIGRSVEGAADGCCVVEGASVVLGLGPGNSRISWERSGSVMFSVLGSLMTSFSLPFHLLVPTSGLFSTVVSFHLGFFFAASGLLSAAFPLPFHFLAVFSVPSSSAIPSSISKSISVLIPSPFFFSLSPFLYISLSPSSSASPSSFPLPSKPLTFLAISALCLASFFLCLSWSISGPFVSACITQSGYCDSASSKSSSSDDGSEDEEEEEEEEDETSRRETNESRLKSWKCGAGRGICAKWGSWASCGGLSARAGWIF